MCFGGLPKTLVLPFSNLASMSLEKLTDIITFSVGHFVDPTQRVYVLYLGCAALLAAIVYRRHHKGSFRDFLSYCFPKTSIQHPGTRTDFVFFLVNRALLFFLIAPTVIGLGPIVLAEIQDWVSALHPTVLPFETSIGVTCAFAITLALGNDFALWCAHRLSHAVPFLWNFHKVHHSAQVLTPITVYRMHPVDDLLAFLGTALSSGLIYGVFYSLFPAMSLPVTFAGTSIFLFVFYVLGFNLRHSHIPLSFGPLNHWIISPVQHQLHHSDAEEHFDKNFGVMFAIWDRMFGTLHLAHGLKKFNFGIGEEGHRFSSVFRCYIEPFITNFRRSKLITVLFALVFISLGATTLGQSFAKPKPQTELWIERLTWNEVASLVADGHHTVIVPTGGVEQRGKHVVLGAHNKVVAAASERIARKLGQTLIAPVISFVPEGDIDAQSGHMAFSGTISVREKTFRALLEDTCRSLAAHGFTRIVLLGDSLGNQAGHEAVATKLNRELQGASILNIPEYYSDNGQVDWLTQQGYSKESIGGHAGIRDTSEMMFVDASGVRELVRKQPGQRLSDGVSGAYWKASSTLGEKLLALKVTRAVEAIRQKTKASE